MARLNRYDRQHKANVALYQRLLDEIFGEAVREAAQLGGNVDFDPSRVFSFDDYPITRERLGKLLSRLGNGIETVILDGIEAEWTLANNKNSELSRRVFGDNIGRLTQEQYRRYFSNNHDARQAFLQRKENGLNLSERVWRYADQFKSDIELGLDIGIRSGLDAPAMARELKQFLNHPDMLFRRIRDEHGILQLSKRASEFHPGQGVYRSSYKNARRLAATETNMAYHTADHERWKQLDFVVGIEIRLSGNHTCMGRDGKPHEFHDICDELQGRYPKDFKFTGWHPHCRCQAISILKTEEELMEENRAILRGEEPSTESVNAVTDVPDSFKQWVADNEERIARAKTMPYFLRDNEQYWNGGGAATVKDIHDQFDTRSAKAVESPKGKSGFFSVDDDKPRFRSMQKSAAEEMKQHKINGTPSTSATGKIYFRSDDIDQILGHVHDTEELAAAKELYKFLPTLTGGVYENLNSERENYQRKLDKGYSCFYSYELEINGITFILKTAVVKGRERPYSLKKKK